MSTRLRLTVCLLLVFVKMSTSFISILVDRRENLKRLHYSMTCPSPEVLSKAEPRGSYNIFLQKPMGDNCKQGIQSFLFRSFSICTKAMESILLVPCQNRAGGSPLILRLSRLDCSEVGLPNQIFPISKENPCRP